MAKLSIKMEQNNNLLSNQEHFVKTMSKNNQNQINIISENDQQRD